MAVCKNRRRAPVSFCVLCQFGLGAIRPVIDKTRNGLHAGENGTKDKSQHHGNRKPGQAVQYPPVLPSFGMVEQAIVQAQDRKAHGGRGKAPKDPRGENGFLGS